MKAFAAIGERLLDKLVPHLKASACCAGTGNHYCCTYCGSAYSTCILQCDCHLLPSCTSCL